MADQDSTMPEATNFSYPLYSEDHPKFGKTATDAAFTLEKPEAAVIRPETEADFDNDWAANLSAAYHKKNGIQPKSTLPQESKEFIARRVLRNDSNATLVDFARRPSSSRSFSAGSSKLQIQVQPGDVSTATSPLKVSPSHEHDSGSFGKFSWRPSLTPLQPHNDGDNHRRLDSDATLVDTGSWARKGSRSGSMSPDVRTPRTKSRQHSALGHWKPALPEVPVPELEEALVRVTSSTSQESRTSEEPQPTRAIESSVVGQREPLKGGARAPTIEDEDDTSAGPAVEVKVPEPEVVADVRSSHQEPEPTLVDPFTDKQYPVIEDPKDTARVLNRRDLINQRVIFSGAILTINAALLVVALVAPARTSGLWVLAFICFIKAKDCVASVIGMGDTFYTTIKHWIKPPPPVESKWILSLIPAYSESEEQIVKTVFSLRDNDVAPHKQVMAIVLDGKTRNVKQHMRITRSFRRHYVTSRFKRNELIINAGFMEDVPVICFEKVKNAGKKDSLILCHDLFNAMRENAPLYTKLLREDIWEEVLPELVGADFPGFDMIFCTDADSTIHNGAVKGLADPIIRDPKCIASCGLVLVELEPGAEWSFWNLYQQFQYNFGQFVRRQAESCWGKVTCLPGCITMIAVRPEMAGAIRKYAEPITAYPVLLHQVQYLGTDRRLTYSMLSQDTSLHTRFVPSAVSETVAPQSIKHYLSQRRRWGSNAYFNNYFYCFGENMIWITRLWASIELLRLSVVYYRVANTALFIYGLTRAFSILKIAPLLVVSQFPTLWFLMNLAIHKPLRVRAHKILLGLGINKFMGPVMSVIIFTNVVRNLGSQAWGMTGGSNATAAPAPAGPTLTEKPARELEPGTSRNSSIDQIAAEEANIGMITTPEMVGMTESEVNEIDREERDKITPVLDGL